MTDRMEKVREALAWLNESDDFVLEDAAAALAEVEQWENERALRDSLWCCTMEDKAAADAVFAMWEKRALAAEDERNKLRGLVFAAKYVSDMHPEDVGEVDKKSMRRLRAALGEPG